MPVKKMGCLAEGTSPDPKIFFKTLGLAEREHKYIQETPGLSSLTKMYVPGNRSALFSKASAPRTASSHPGLQRGRNILWKLGNGCAPTSYGRFPPSHSNR